MADFKFDQRALDKLAKQAVEAKAKEIQAMLDRLSRSCQGKPVDEVKRTLKREWERDGGKITDPELSQYAEVLATGGRVQVRT
jgi:hypothetical protein